VNNGGSIEAKGAMTGSICEAILSAVNNGGSIEAGFVHRTCIARDVIIRRE